MGDSVFEHEHPVPGAAVGPVEPVVLLPRDDGEGGVECVQFADLDVRRIDAVRITDDGDAVDHPVVVGRHQRRAHRADDPPFGRMETHAHVDVGDAAIRQTIHDRRLRCRVVDADEGEVQDVEKRRGPAVDAHGVRDDAAMDAAVHEGKVIDLSPTGTQIVDCGRPGRAEGGMLLEDVVVEEMDRVDAAFAHEVEDVGTGTTEPNDADGLPADPVVERRQRRARRRRIEIGEITASHVNWNRAGSNAGRGKRIDRSGGAAEKRDVGEHVLVMVVELPPAGFGAEHPREPFPGQHHPRRFADVDAHQRPPVGLARGVADPPCRMDARRYDAIACHREGNQQLSPAHETGGFQVGNARDDQHAVDESYGIALVDQPVDVRLRTCRCG